MISVQSRQKLWRILPAGFYYKTFMWPPSLWLFYEKFIRKAAGLGVSPNAPDPDAYDKLYAHTDVLIVGGGVAGLQAACAAAARGARVMLVDEGCEFGGALLREHVNEHINSDDDEHINDAHNHRRFGVASLACRARRRIDRELARNFIAAHHA